jgi:exosortase O
MTTLETSARPNPIRAMHLAANALVLAVWLWLYRAVFAYLAIIFTYEDFRTNQIVLVGVLVLIALQARKEKWTLRFDALPQTHLLPLVLVFAGSILYLIAERWLDINTISASIFFLASYGLFGLWIAPQRWRAGLPAALLIVGVLPFGDHMQTFIGYPMRIITASIVRDGLALAGIGSIGVDTILILENGVSQIDLPCSGVKSLWTGALFLIAATWIERRPLNARWWVIAIIFAILLFITNLARVAILVVVGQVLNARLAAELIHVPLGVLGFAIACAAAVALLRLLPTQSLNLQSLIPNLNFSSAWLGVILIVTIFGMGLLYTPRPQTGLTQPTIAWTFPADIIAQSAPLKPDELEWLMRDNAKAADRFRFTWRDLSGSMILVASATWRAHHRPERCFEVYGLAIHDSRASLVAPDFPVRLVVLGDARKQQTWSAAYWFQSAARVTDDYGTRIWDDVTLQPKRWVLVSILFNDARDPNAPELQTFFRAVRDAVAHNLSEE